MAVLTVAGARPVVMPEARCQVSNGLAKSACSKRVRAVAIGGEFGIAEGLQEGACNAGSVVGCSDGFKERVVTESDLVKMFCPSLPAFVALLVRPFGFAEEDSGHAGTIEEIQHSISLGKGLM